MQEVRRQLDYFDISQICDSGQCFRMSRLEDDSYAIIAKDRYLRLVQNDKECLFYCGEEEFDTFWKQYFDLDTDYSAFIGQISPRDKYLSQAAAEGSGIRILRQDLWEMIVSFLISQQNHIVRIRRCIENLCIKYGEERQNFDGSRYYTFPAPEALAFLDEEALKECNLGNRSKYVVRTAKSIAEGQVSLEDIKSLPYRKARGELLKLYGIGEKVADCICLFALHNLEAFPVDTHIRQALEAHYPKGFPKRRYKGFQGIMQQYIFYHELMGNR